MQVHEFQAKKIIASYGVYIPRGKVVLNEEEAVKAAKYLYTDKVVVKAQIHAGGRGKGGGVKVCRELDDVAGVASKILGDKLVTPQTGAEGKKVHKLLIEEGVGFKKELYLSFLVNRSRKNITLITSTEGGMEIEEVAGNNPEKILMEDIDPTIGLQPYQARRIAFKLGLEKMNPKLVSRSVKFLMRLYKAFEQNDASLLEINPWVVANNDELVALDCKMTIDDNAVYRQPKIMEMHDPLEDVAVEAEAAKYLLNFVKLNGNIGCMVNGAGLAMATMDIVKMHGGEPANFLDVGGGVTQERVEKAFNLITEDTNVKCIFINIFGGIVKCDLIALGIIEAIKRTHLSVPIVARLKGTHSEEALEIINNAQMGEKFQLFDDLDEAAKMAVHYV